MRCGLITIWALTTAFAAHAQSQPRFPESAALGKDLYKKTPYVRSARVNACILTVTVDVSASLGLNPLAGTMPGSMPTEGELSAISGSGG